jgi:integration host factor subunit beta
MNKSDIINILSLEFADLTKSEIKKACDIVFEQISSSLVNEDRVEIRGFGSFSLRERLVSSNVNDSKNTVTKSKTNQKVVYYRAGKELTDKVN